MANEEPLLGDGTKYEAMQSDDSEDTDDDGVSRVHDTVYTTFTLSFVASQSCIDGQLSLLPSGGSVRPQ